ncbi:MAG: hypothetical protein A2066_09335 [Bacteroidetes bacterium GWB2_41_8]|nr:MAG: hypothetical protein A2066_09335 [Bacteroidetes bacterium GWB2_41_8]
MKEDILEQLVDGWFLRQPATFTKHNVKYRPKSEDIKDLDTKEKSQYAVHSDIDVIAVHLNRIGTERVSVVSCKSWQDGFDVDFFYKNLGEDGDPNKKVGTGSAWKKFREIYNEKWAKAFGDKIFEETQSHDFTYIIAITKFKGNKRKHEEDFMKCPLFLNNLNENGKHKVKIKFLTLFEMLKDISGQDAHTAIESTEIGRFMQLINAAELDIVSKSKVINT